MSKRYRKYVLEFTYNLEHNLLELQQELISQTYKHGPYRKFIVCDSKKREIKAAPFRDRVVHHALCNLIEPIFDQSFIFDSFACRKNKGTHKAIKRLQTFLKSANSSERERERERERAGSSQFFSDEEPFDSYCCWWDVPYWENIESIYCLQCDISKYFNNIDHQILLEMVKKKISDKRTIWLVKEILDSSEERPGAGIPIGNLTSQLFANIYLNELDQFIKHNLRIRHYLRYMDDFLILDFDKRKLQKIKIQIQEFLDGLRLELHPKKANVFLLADKGIGFLGYKIFVNYRLLRKDTIKRFRKRTRLYKKMLGKREITQEKFDDSLQSWLAYAEFGNSYYLRKQVIYQEKLQGFALNHP
jgi:retron-type reverse transcriptase